MHIDIHTDIGIVFCNTMCYQFMSGYIVRNNDTIKAPFFAQCVLHQPLGKM